MSEIEKTRKVRLIGGRRHGELIKVNDATSDRIAIPIQRKDGSFGQERYTIRPGEYANSPDIGELEF